MPNGYVFSEDYPSFLPIIYPNILPRETKAVLSHKDGGHDLPIFRALVRSSAYRTQRLVNNVDELFRELVDTTSSYNSKESALRKELDELEYEPSSAELEWSFNRARNAISDDTWRNLTDEHHIFSIFRTFDMDIDQYEILKRSCRKRHAWGQYLRSDLDWDWDLAGSLKRMHRLPRQ